MGCAKSKAAPEDNRSRTQHGQPDHVTVHVTSGSTFTDIQVDIIKSTWPLIAENLTVNGTYVFRDIFAAEPAVRGLFPFRHLRGNALINDPLFRSHATKFMQTLDVVCDTLPCLDMDCPVSRRLMVLGAQHATIDGFDVMYFSIFAKCLHLTWEKVLGEEYTEEVKEAWTLLFEFIMERIRDGYALYNLDNSKHRDDQ